ncbi:MAG: hypothetical protein IH988_06625 [Planctomycetes bacterium]|nr:hypothetical protein [Planctomycetota bacterium]
MKIGFYRTLLALASVAWVAPVAEAEVIFETEDPFGGPFGMLGFDVFEDQSVAQRFTSTGDFTLDQISLWIWNNDPSNTHPITITLREDANDGGGGSIPSDVILESWTIEVPVTGKFNPLLFDFPSVVLPTLDSGVKYWIAAESPTQPTLDPVWAIASPDNGFMSFAGSDGVWSPGANSGNTAMIVMGTPVTELCEGDANGDGTVDPLDSGYVLARFGCSVGTGDLDCDSADQNGDGAVDPLDSGFVLARFGECP